MARENWRGTAWETTYRSLGSLALLSECSLEYSYFGIRNYC